MRVMSEAVNENAEGYNTVVENREGGGGAVGWSYFYGLDGEPGNLVKAESAINTLPLQEGVEVPWTYEDFTPIALFGEDSRMIVAQDRKSTRLNSSHVAISYAVFCLNKKK